MNTLLEKPASELYSAHNSIKPINLYCNAPDAHSVEVAGDFNHWFALPMHRHLDGWWHVQVMLCHGHHRYRFLVDGKPRLDPTATGVGRDERGEQVSLIAVS
jgi:1,4-alpha-glucan branching enzyme